MLPGVVDEDEGEASLQSRSIQRCGDADTGLPAMTLGQRWRFILTLWPYMVPLIVVYFAEYTIQVRQTQKI